MAIHTVTHLNFRGDAAEALSFYQAAFGGDKTCVTYKDAHAVTDPDEAGQIMWGQVVSADGFRIMAFDVPSARPWNAGEIPVFVSVRGDDAEALTRYWKALSEGASIVQPLGPFSYTPLYGMLKDRFGVTWVLDLAVEYAPG
ncbi:MAG TPA: VOC family protein [Telluria sp.]|jgi:PhnB protein